MALHALQGEGDGSDANAAPAGGEEEEEEEDAWRVLDPHDSSSHVARPFKKGRITRRPAAAKTPSEAGGSAPIDLWAKQMRSLRAPALPEFTDLFLQERSRLNRLRLASAKAGALGAGKRGGGPSGGFVISRMMDLMEPEEDDDIPAPGGAGPEVEEVEEAWQAGGDFVEAADFAFAGDGEGMEVRYGDTATPTGSSRGAGAGGGAGKGWDLLSYEELCRQHVDKLLKVDDMLHRSELETRVRDWRKKIEPALEAEEARKQFDIHEYGEEVKTRLFTAVEALPPAQRNDASFTFAVAAPLLPRHEVCRAHGAMCVCVCVFVFVCVCVSVSACQRVSVWWCTDT